MGAAQSITAQPIQIEVQTKVEAKEEQQTREPEPVAVPQTTEEPKKDIFERYIEPQGTKIEVQPAEVTESVDVVKKTKKKKS